MPPGPGVLGLIAGKGVEAAHEEAVAAARPQPHISFLFSNNSSRNQGNRHNQLQPHRIDRYSPQLVSKRYNFIAPIKDYSADKVTPHLATQFFQPFKVILINSISALAKATFLRVVPGLKPFSSKLDKKLPLPPAISSADRGFSTPILPAIAFPCLPWTVNIHNRENR